MENKINEIDSTLDVKSYLGEVEKTIGDTSYIKLLDIEDEETEYTVPDLDTNYFNILDKELGFESGFTSKRLNEIYDKRNEKYIEENKNKKTLSPEQRGIRNKNRRKKKRTEGSNNIIRILHPGPVWIKQLFTEKIKVNKFYRNDIDIVYGWKYLIDSGVHNDDLWKFTYNICQIRVKIELLNYSKYKFNLVIFPYKHEFEEKGLLYNKRKRLRKNLIFKEKLIKPENKHEKLIFVWKKKKIIPWIISIGCYSNTSYKIRPYEIIDIILETRIKILYQVNKRKN